MSLAVRFPALRPIRHDRRRDITALVDAACVARAISTLAASFPGDPAVQRRPAGNDDGWFEDGVWYEPASTVATRSSGRR
jgi:transposase